MFRPLPLTKILSLSPANSTSTLPGKIYRVGNDHMSLSRGRGRYEISRLRRAGDRIVGFSRDRKLEDSVECWLVSRSVVRREEKLRGSVVG